MYFAMMPRAVRRLAIHARGALVAMVAAGLPASAAATDLLLVSIATGPKTGVYYNAGGAICGLVNEHRWDHGIRCVTGETGGSIDNLRAVRSGAATFGIVQSDWQYHAARGTSVFEGVGPNPDLRTLFSLYPEPFTVVTRPGSGITRFSDLLGKRVNIGPSGSGSRATMQVVMEDLGWSTSDFAGLSDIGTADLPRALCDGEIDAAVLIIAHPNLTIEEMITSCDATLVPVEGPEADRLVAAHPYYSSYLIAGGTYPDQPGIVPTFALAATMVTSSRTPPSVVYEVVKAVAEGMSELRQRHSAFAELTTDRLQSDGLTAPLHTGARRYYETVGQK